MVSWVTFALRVSELRFVLVLSLAVDPSTCGWGRSLSAMGGRDETLLTVRLHSYRVLGVCFRTFLW